MSLHKIVDMGMHFDGKCAICRQWIDCLNDPVTQLDEPTTNAKHIVAHRRCAYAASEERS